MIRHRCETNSRPNKHNQTKHWYLRKGRTLVGRETRQKLGWQSFRLAKGDVAYGGVPRGLGLLFPSPVDVRIARCGITELNSTAAPRLSKSVVETGDASVGSGSRKRGVPTGSARSRSDGMGTVALPLRGVGVGFEEPHLRLIF